MKNIIGDHWDWIDSLCVHVLFEDIKWEKYLTTKNISLIASVAETFRVQCFVQISFIMSPIFCVFSKTAQNICKFWREITLSSLSSEKINLLNCLRLFFATSCWNAFTTNRRFKPKFSRVKYLALTFQEVFYPQ